VKDATGRLHQEDNVGATRRDLDSWIRPLPASPAIAMKAMIFTEWIYFHLQRLLQLAM